MKKAVFSLALVLCAVVLVYLGHFNNTFHFDDLHTIVDNPYIRDLRFVPKFFTDATTFSILPRNRTYRPIVSMSLAIDYWLGGGLKSFFFQFSTFCWFLVQLVLMYMLFRDICDKANPDPRNHVVALIATAWYGLHPAMAETLNYVIQRGDLYSTLGIVGGIVIYARAPRLRKFGIYLVPVALALLSKPPALIFPAILFVYIWLFEEPRKLGRAVLACAPALALTGALGWFMSVMTPRTFAVGPVSGYAYRITQPLVALRYFRTFLAPGNLTADTDLAPIPSIFSNGAWLGFVFVLAILAVAVLCSKRREYRPIAFGLWWFVLALVPTSIFPLAEVENDHRMFFPFVGLVLSATWPVALWIYRAAPRRIFRIGLGAVCVLEFAILALATVQRNVVWRTEESLWRDVTEKSPNNPRGLLNYGGMLALKGDYARALTYLERSGRLAPNYALVDVNLGVVLGKLGRAEEAEEHFKRAAWLLDNDPMEHYLYGIWLNETGRQKEAIEQFRLAVHANPDYLQALYRLLEIYAKRESWDTVQRLSDFVRNRFPTDDFASAYRLMASRENPNLPRADSLSSPDNLVSLSAAYYEAGRFQRAAEAAKDALKLRPNDPEAFNNLAAAYRSLGDCEQSMAAAREALRIRRPYPSAQKNLALCAQR